MMEGLEPWCIWPDLYRRNSSKVQLCNTMSLKGVVRIDIDHKEGLDSLND